MPLLIRPTTRPLPPKDVHFRWSTTVLAAAVIVGAAGVALAPSASAQTAADDARRKLELQRRELTEADKRAGELQADVAGLRAERARINDDLLQTAKLIQAGEAQLTTIERRQDELAAQESLVRGSLEAKHGSLSGLLAAMQRMGRNPPPVMITRREDALAMVRSAMLIASAFPELRSQALALADQLNDLVKVQTAIRTEGEKLKAETQRLGEARARLAGLLETKKKSLTDRQDELARVRKAANDISRNVGDLNELIGKLDKAISENTRLGAYEKELAAAAAKAPPPAEVPTSPPAVVAAAEPAPKSVKTTEIKPPDVKPAPSAKAPAQPSITLAPGDRLAMATPSRLQPDMPFHQAKGRLPLPAQGRRVLSFGDKTQRGTKSDGMVIETRHGAQITAPSDGWVMHAGEFRTYGHILIINAGGGYHILLAGLSQIDVPVGQFVLAGEPVGTMAPPSRSQTVRTEPARTEKSAPVLYVEFRKDQKPIDPEPWWLGAGRRVEG